MGFHTISDIGVRYGLIAFDRKGIERPEAGGMFNEKLIEEVSTQRITNVFFFSHGWKGDLPAAIEQYDSWIAALMKAPDLQKAQQIFPDFCPLLIGLHWPSLPWGDEEVGGEGSFAPLGGFG